MGVHFYRILEVVPTTFPPKQCHKVISHAAKFILFTIFSKGEQKEIATIVALAQDLSFQHKHIVEEKEDIVSSPTMLPTHCPIKPRYNRLVEQIQPHQQQVCDSLQQTKQHDFSIRESSSPRFKFNKRFPFSPGNSTQWRPLFPKEGGFI
jgi:hypothetical protein